MPRGKRNGTTGSGSSQRNATKFGNFVRSRKRNVVVDAEPTIDEFASDDDAINRIVADDNFDSDNGIVVESGNSFDGSGSNGDGRGSGRGRSGSDGSGRGGDNSSADTPKRRGRRSAEDRARELAESDSISIEEARKIIETQKKPRKVKSFSSDLEAGVAGSAILLGGIFEGGSQLLAMALANKQFDRSYIKLEKDESQSLGDAVLKVLEAQSKHNRKRFDEFMKKLYPYWNLAKVLTEIGYPRYEIYRMELELKLEIAKQANAANASENTTGDVDKRRETASSGVSSDTSFTSRID